MVLETPTQNKSSQRPTLQFNRPSFQRSTKTIVQQIDWSGIRANAIILGVREAARRAAINLTPEESNRFVKRVLKRSERQGWITQKKAALAQPLTEQQALPVSSIVVNGSDAMLSRLKEHGDNTKQNLAEVAENASKVLLKKKGNALLKQHQAFKNFVSGSGQLHGWDEGKGSTGPTLNVLSIGGEMHISSSQ